MKIFCVDLLKFLETNKVLIRLAPFFLLLILFKLPLWAKSSLMHSPSFSGSWLNALTLREKQDSLTNPDNRVQEIPAKEARSLLSLDGQVQFSNWGRGKIRPAIWGNHTLTPLANPSEEKTLTVAKVDLNEAYLQAQLNELNLVVVGLQNYQWGPGELLGPSNPLYHFNWEQKSIHWQDKGKFLARYNLTFARDWSIVALAELVSNQQTPWLADKDFERKALLKGEWRSSENANSYLGASAGTYENETPFIGQYASFVPIDGFAIYLDSRQTTQAEYYQPTDHIVIPEMKLMESNNHVQSLTLVGLRYEGDWDWRGEFVHNSMGYTKRDLQQAQLAGAAFNPNVEKNRARLRAPGLEVMGQNYGYASLRIPDIGSSKKSTLIFRYLHSFMDDSASLQSNWDYNFSDTSTWHCEIATSIGSKNQEFTLGEKWRLLIGHKLYF